MTIEVSTVGHDRAVLHDGATVIRLDGLDPDRDHEHGDVTFRTLPRPDGALLSRFATVNDVHFGEKECGVIGGMDLGPPLTPGPDEPPYPQTMNAAAIEEITAIDPAAVVAKGDLTTNGTDDEYQQFLDHYGAAFGQRLVHVRGNHDAYHGADFAAFPHQRVDLPGVTLAVLDTSVPGSPAGALTDDQVDWLDDLAARADRPVLVFGHHHPWSPDSNERPDGYFGIHPTSSERLVDVVARRPRIRGYFAGHTHRNRVRTFTATGDVPYVEVACTKDFPGAWAEYEVYEDGILQVHHRISSPDALAWTERTREMFFGHYPEYAFGTLDDRCFLIPT